MVTDSWMETSRLLVRETNFEDCRIFAGWEEREDVFRYLPLPDDHSYQAVVTDFVLAGQDESRRLFTITEKPTSVPVGRIVLTRIDDRKDALTVGLFYIGDESRRKQGLAKEAAKALLEFSFLSLHRERVAVDLHRDDQIGQLLCRKLGFLDEGVLRHAGKYCGKYVDLCRMSMLRSDYYNTYREK